jgi:hypothetical protein
MIKLEPSKFLEFAIYSLNDAQTISDLVLHFRLNNAANLRSTQGIKLQDMCLMQLLQKGEDIQQLSTVYLIDLESHVKHPFPELMWVSY